MDCWLRLAHAAPGQPLHVPALRWPRYHCHKPGELWCSVNNILFSHASTQQVWFSLGDKQDNGTSKQGGQMSSLQHRLKGCENRRRPQLPPPWCYRRVLDTEQSLAFCHTTQRHKLEEPVCAFSSLLIIPYICWDALATRVHTAVLPEDCQLSSPILPPLLISQCWRCTAPDSAYSFCCQ